MRHFCEFWLDGWLPLRGKWLRYATGPLCFLLGIGLTAALPTEELRMAGVGVVFLGIGLIGEWYPSPYSGKEHRPDG